MELIAQIALGVIIGGLTIALLVTGFFVWNSRQRNERLALGLFIAGAVIVLVLVVVVASHQESSMAILQWLIGLRKYRRPKRKEESDG
jgi:hypothetical protein